MLGIYSNETHRRGTGDNFIADKFFGGKEDRYNIYCNVVAGVTLLSSAVSALGMGAKAYLKAQAKIAEAAKAIEEAKPIVDEGAGTVNISSNTAKHIDNAHNPNKYAQQLKFKPQDAAIKELQNKSFFNSSWSSAQIENAVNSGYNQAIGKGISTETYTFTHAGEIVTIALQNGAVQTAWGSYQYTYQQLLNLLK